MKLSIAMIVKNEEKNLGRTLESIKALDGKLDYEIVIVDTGSTDRTKEIASKYTNKLYEHEWTGNFAEMRNVSINYCKGEWILILDGDEVLENPEELISFFASKVSGIANSVIIKFKNILTDNKEKYLLAGLVRLFRKHKDFKYIGRIHEQPFILEPVVSSKITLVHYGYSREDYNLMNYKFERNKALLLKDIEIGREPIYTRFQLSQTYAMANKEKEALTYIVDAFKLVKSEKAESKYMYVYHFYARCLYQLRKYEECIEICLEALRYSKKYLDFYYLLVRSNIALNKYEEANKYINTYFTLHKEKETGSLDDISVSDFSFSRRNEIVRDNIVILYSTKKYNKLINCFENILDDKLKSDLKELYFYSCIKMDRAEKIKEYYINCELGDDDINNIVSVMLKIDLEGDLNIKNHFQNYYNIDKKLDAYIDLVLLDKNNNFEQKEIDFKVFYSWKGDILKALIKNSKENIALIENVNNLDIEKYILHIENDYEILKDLIEFSAKNFLNVDIKKLNLLVAIEKRLVFNKSINNEAYKYLVQRTLINRMNYLRNVYSDEIFKDNNYKTILSNFDMLWIELSTIIGEYNNDKLKYLRRLKAILKEFEFANSIIDEFKKFVDQKNMTPEMFKERKRLLEICHKYMESGDVINASIILNELNSIFIFDGEILNDLGVVYYMQGENDSALLNLAMAYELQQEKFDAAYNLGCVLDNLNRDSSKYYFSKAYSLCNNIELKSEIEKLI